MSDLLEDVAKERAIGGSVARNREQFLGGASMTGQLLDLEWLVDYELRCAARYRRFVSLVIVGTHEEHRDLKSLLGKTLRSSDELFDSESGTVILMTETDELALSKAIRRLQEACTFEMDLRFGAAFFPKDTHTATDLLSLAGRRFLRARMGPPGAVVSTG